jgi:hypothetical protein
MPGDQSSNNLYCQHGHICRFRGYAMKKEFVLNALRSKGYKVELYAHNKEDGRWQVCNGDFEVHPGYRDNKWSGAGTVDTIVSGKKGWKKKEFDLIGVAQTLQTALEEENRQ